MNQRSARAVGTIVKKTLFPQKDNAAAAKSANALTVTARPNVAAQTKFAGLLKARNKIIQQLRRNNLQQADAEELFQTALIQAIENFDQLKDQHKLEAWFKTILRNKMNDHFRALAKERMLTEKLADTELEYIDGLETDLCQCTLKLINLLKPEFKDVLKYRILEGYDLKTTAKNLGISESLVKVRTHRAKEEMKVQLKECCGMKTLSDAADCPCDEPKY